MKPKQISWILSAVIALSLVLSACGGAATPTAEPTQAEVQAEPAATEAPAQEQPAADAATEEPDAGEPAVEEPAEAEPITLRYFMWDPSFEETEQLVVDKFMESHPNITVEMETVSTPDYWTRLSAMSASNELPCVFSMSSGFIDQWIMDDLALDIQPYVDQDINPDDYYSGVFDVVRNKANGNMHAFPYAFVETVLFYNKDAFDAAGVAYPDDTWTWETFLDAAKKLTVDNNDDGVIDQYGFWTYGRYAHVESWVYQNGGDLLNEDKTRFAPDENAVEALSFLASLVTEHKVAPTPAEMEGVRNQDVFPLGMAAMWVDGAWNIDNTREVAADSIQWGIAPIPRGPHNEGVDVAYGWPDNLAIAKTCENPDEAWEFIKYITGPDRTIDLTFPGKIPVYKEVAFSEEFLETGMQPDNKDFLLEWAEFTGPTSYTPGWGEWRGYTDGAGLEGQLSAVYNGEIDLETALANVTEYANGVLTRYYP